MTSNLGSEYLVSLGEDQDVDVVRDQVMNVVRSHFRPEFLNRLDEIILFHRLKREHMGAIVDYPARAAAEAARPIARSRSCSITARKTWLADKGYDPAYGARPLKRVIQSYLQDPLAEEILAGRISDGETVEVGAGKDGLTINGENGDGGRDRFGVPPGELDRPSRTVH